MTGAAIVVLAPEERRDTDHILYKTKTGSFLHWLKHFSLPCDLASLAAATS